ncbi:Pollen receptor-like kinase 3 [Linum perenne]
MAAVHHHHHHHHILLFLLLLLLLSFLHLSFSLPDEEEALLKFKDSLNHGGALDGWSAGSSPCADRWVGVVCEDGKTVSDIRLAGFSLSGSIDVDALQKLQNLRTISFSKNSFEGPIPAFNKLGALKALFLSSNMFSGEIPDDFFATMSSLKKVWLDGNKFTGKIPDSITSLRNLKELHLEANQFSGSIPPLKDPPIKLTSLDLSKNRLKGPIPESLDKFNASAFAGNKGLCGRPLPNPCPDDDETKNSDSEETPSPPPLNKEIVQVPPPPPLEEGQQSGAAGVVAILIIVMVIVITILSSLRKNGDEEFTVLEKENLNKNEAAAIMPVSLPSSGKKSSNSNRKGDNNKRAVAGAAGRNGMGDLIMINNDKGPFGLPDLMKAAAEVLGNGGLGSAYKATMPTVKLSVVVKRIREMNMLGRDLFDAEMRRFGRIRHSNILTPLAYHFRKEEKLLVSEYMPKGSLLYLMHGDRGICHSDLNWKTRLKIIKGIANGLSFLHSEYASYNLPHGNLKSSNVLLSDTYEPFLGDYALDPLVNPSHASQAMFAYKSPEYTQYNQVSHKSDVYCLGIIILEVMTGKFPSQYLTNGKGGTDVVQWVVEASREGREREVLDPEMLNIGTNSVERMVQLLQVGLACIETDPTQRLDMGEAIRRIEEIQI